VSRREIADAEEAVAVLRWWAAAGVDAVYDEAPRNRFAEAARPAPRPSPAPKPALAAPPAAASRKSVVAPAISAAPDAAARTAAQWAAEAQSLEALAEAMNRFEGCALKRTATQLVFADGAPGAAVMIVGEAPGADEDRLGRPFVGRAGQLLDLMLAAVGLDRSQVYIANVVPWRPPGNRTPTPQETAICQPFIRRQIELCAPRVLVTMGNPSTQTLLGVKEGITRIRGVWRSYEVSPGTTIAALPTLHPAYLLRSPNAKRWSWLDLRALRAALDRG
jgi:uracil-DNA glycosylase family 4